MTVLTVPAFRDNYLWLICKKGHAVVVDPGVAQPIEAALQQHQLQLDAILLTHHHQDHTGGVAELLRTRPDLPVFGPRHENIAQVTNPLGQGDELRLDKLALTFSVLDVPGHTSGHIAYFGYAAQQPLLFCGDTLFAGGCGRLFEGTAQQMHHSLGKLAALPEETQVYCAHEYTLANLKFAAAVEPDNADLWKRIVDARALREAGQPTLPSTIGLEKRTNPFLRFDVRAVRAAAEAIEQGASKSGLQTFAAIRSWKDRF